MVDMTGRVLIVAGSDSGGGAGIQADIKAVTALGGFAMTAVTALTAQNTRGVQDIFEVPPAFVRAQLESVLGDLGADCIKLGMLHRPDVIDVVADALAELAPGVPIVCDPVMVAKGGASLLAESAQDALRRRIIPMAMLITPNLPEAEVLTGLKISSRAEMSAAMDALAGLGAEAVLLKGGHLDEDAAVVDLLRTQDGALHTFEGKRIATPNTHGTGCTLASAIACGIAQGRPLTAAVSRARDYVRRAIAGNPGFGHGHGPLNHAVTVADLD